MISSLSILLFSILNQVFMRSRCFSTARLILKTSKTSTVQPSVAMKAVLVVSVPVV